MKPLWAVYKTETTSIVDIAGFNVHISLCYKSCNDSDVSFCFLLLRYAMVELWVWSYHYIWLPVKSFLMLCLQYYNCVAKLALRKILA